MQFLIVLCFVAVASATSLAERGTQDRAFCELPAERGTCRGYFIRFNFDKESGQCKPFVYGGCGGNDNNFESDKECYDACGNQVCPSNESYTDCVVPCNDCRIRGKCNFLLCNPGCDCKRGHYRDSNRSCIPVDQCPSKKS